LPYKDPEQRRRYDREYKRRLRARLDLIKPGPTWGRKAYLCLRFPHLRLEGLVFRDGWFITADPEEQAIIEQNQAYGQQIVSWRVEP
jgi:hypothetical protein